MHWKVFFIWNKIYKFVNIKHQWNAFIMMNPAAAWQAHFVIAAYAFDRPYTHSYVILFQQLNLNYTQIV